MVFVEALRRTFPQFAQKGKDGRFSQQDAEECYSQIVHQLRSRLKIKEEHGETSFVDRYIAGKFSTTLKCTEDTPDEMPVETTEEFFNLKCHITAQTNFLRDGILAGLEEDIEKNSPTLGRDAIYRKTSRITRLPKYLAVCPPPLSICDLSNLYTLVVPLCPLLLETRHQQEDQDHAQGHVPL